MALGDFNGDGWPDVMDIWGGILLGGPAGFNGIELLQAGMPLTVPLQSARAPLRIATLDGSTLQVFEKQSDAWMLVSSQKLGFTAYIATAFDYDHDGYADLAITSADGEEMTLLLGQPDGSFASAASFALPDWTAQLLAADFDGDGLIDLAFQGTQHVYLMLNKGGLQFELRVVATLTGSAGFNLAIADFDRNGAPDLAYIDGKALVLLLNEGDGLFDAQQVFLAGDNDAIGSPVSGDLDGDGAPDLAFRFNQATMVMFNKGDGTFSPPVAIPGSDNLTNYFPLGLATGDIDDDGRSDIVGFGLEGLQVFLSREGRSFSATSYSPSPFWHGSIVDVDGDLRPDIVGDGMVLYNRCLP